MEFVLGMPGAGKGLFCCRYLVRLLRDDWRPIVTNLAIDLDKLQAWCDGPNGFTCNVRNRIHLLTQLETGHFWRIRRHVHHVQMDSGETVEQVRWVEVPPDMRDGKAIACSGIDAETQQTIYIIDEGHLHFAARNWRAIEFEGLWYVSQHRHFGDDVLIATQNLTNLDKTFRELGQEYHLLENLGKQSKRGLGFGQFFKRLSYFSPPRRGCPADNGPVYTRLPADIIAAGWYSTSAGVGIAATEGSADKAANKRGVRPVVWVPVVVLLLVAGLFVVRAAPGLLGSVVRRADVVPVPSGVPAPLADGGPPAAALAPRPASPSVLVVDGYAGGMGAILAGQWLAVQSVDASGPTLRGWLVDGRPFRVRSSWEASQASSMPTAGQATAMPTTP